MSNTSDVDYTQLRQVIAEVKSSWDSLTPRLKEWFGAHGIDTGKIRLHMYPPNNDDTEKHCTVFLSLPGDDVFDIFSGNTPQEIFDQITKRCESRVAAAPTSKDAVHLTVMNLPVSDMAYTNAVYINDKHLERGSLLFPEGTTHVRVNDSRIFPLIKSPLVQQGCIAMSSLQRDSFDPQLPLARLTKVSPCDVTAETKVAESVCIEFEPVANFRVEVDASALVDFLRLEFKGQMVYPGTTLASIKFMKRVFKYRVISGEGRIDDSTRIQLIVNAKCKDVVTMIDNGKRSDAKIGDDKDENEAFKALLKEWDLLQAQVANVQRCVNVFRRVHENPI